MNASATAPEIAQEAARSLLERLREKTALVRFFRYNASAKHGVPIDPDREVVFAAREKTPEPEPKPETKVEPKAEPRTRAEPLNLPQNVIYANGPAATENGTWKVVALVLAIMAGATGMSALGWLLGRAGQSQSATTTEQFSQSPYQFLEDMGAHWYE